MNYYTIYVEIEGKTKYLGLIKGESYVEKKEEEYPLLNNSITIYDDEAHIIAALPDARVSERECEHSFKEYDIIMYR